MADRLLVRPFLEILATEDAAIPSQRTGEMGTNGKHRLAQSSTMPAKPLIEKGSLDEAPTPPKLSPIYKLSTG